MSKKILSITVPESLVEAIDRKVTEVGAKSRSAFISEIIEQSLSGRTFSLSDEQHAALLTYAKAVRMSPEEIAKTVLARVAEAGEKVEERFEHAIPVIPTD